MRRSKKILIFTLCLLAALFAAALLAPSLLLPTVVRQYASQLELELVAIGTAQIGIRSANLDHIELGSDQLRISLEGLQLGYTARQLIAGDLQLLSAQKLELEFLPSQDEAPTVIERSFTDLLQLISSIPIAQISIAEIEVVSGTQRVTAALELQPKPFRVNGSLSLSAYENIDMDLRAQQLDEGRIAISAQLKVDDELISSSDIELSIDAKRLSAEATTTLLPNALERLSVLDPRISAVLSTDEAITINSRASLENEQAGLAITEFMVELSKADSTLRVDIDDNSFRLNLPLQLSLTRFDQSGFSISSNDLLLAARLQQAGSDLAPAYSANVDSTFSGIALDCVSLTNCKITGDLTTELGQWQFDNLSGAEVSARGAVEIALANDQLSLSSFGVDLIVPSLFLGERSILGDTLSLQLADLNFRTGVTSSGNLTFLASDVSLLYPQTSISPVTVSGTVALGEELISGAVEVSLDRRSQIDAVFQHHLIRKTGDSEILLADTPFTQALPLSSFVSISDLNADVVAGTVGALANISWSQQEDLSWELGGPLHVNLSELSGYYEDSFFVDLTSSVSAEIGKDFGLRTWRDQDASMASLDIGIPLENVTWTMQFDSSLSEFSLQNLSADVLGGKAEIPQLDYQPQRPRNQFDLVLSNMDLATIVALADYPSLLVEGLISGYLPLNVNGSLVTITDGLVGALEPGGSIRYLPANGIASSNPSVQLVNDALSNYQFSTMNTDVIYDENGDLELAVQLRGRNPDMNSGQDINLNINISDNIPSLLRSLQASRVISDALEQSVRR